MTVDDLKVLGTFNVESLMAVRMPALHTAEIRSWEATPKNAAVLVTSLLCSEVGRP